MKDIETDPTLQHKVIECPRCHDRDAVFFQDQGKRLTTSMVLFYKCTKCKYEFQDKENKTDRERQALKG